MKWRDRRMEKLVYLLAVFSLAGLKDEKLMYTSRLYFQYIVFER
jgi:hypothetical protein